MNPNTVPWLVCALVCIWPILLGVLTFIALRIMARRVPVFHTWTEQPGDGTRHLFIELSSMTHAERQAELQADAAELQDKSDGQV